MPNNIIDKIQVSGVTYTLSAETSGGGGNPTVELTQAEYDALVSAGTVSADTYYIITDAQSPDITQYWTSAQTQSAITQATSGKVNTSSVVSSVTSASTDSEIPTAKAVFDAIPTGGTGGGKAISAGTNISVTTGETADTVSCTLNASNGVGGNTLVEGYSTTAVTYASHAEGYETEANAKNGDVIYTGHLNAHAEGFQTKAYGYNSHTEGRNTIANNATEHACGRFNVSSSASTTFGDSGNTLFSVGNGTSANARHNAFEIRQNGDIYLNDGSKLQDTVSATTANTTALGGMKIVKLTQSAYDALSPNYDSNTLYIIKD